MPRQPFEVFRAVFWLLAIVIAFEMMLTVFAGAGCFWLILSGRYELGACQNTGTQIREIFAEVLAAVLALLLAAKNGGPPRPPPPPSEPPPE
jgi:hypothetical protein